MTAPGPQLRLSVILKTESQIDGATIAAAFGCSRAVLWWWRMLPVGNAAFQARVQLSVLMARNRGCVVVMACALTGCALGPEYLALDPVLPVNFTVPPAAREPSSGGVSADLWQWCRSLRDPRLNRQCSSAGPLH
jgi:hypothetical protein